MNDELIDILADILAGKPKEAGDVKRLAQAHAAIIEWAERVGIKPLERAAAKEFEKLCAEVRTNPNLGNSTKSKKDNFLDGAEIMLTAVQAEAAAQRRRLKGEA